MSIVRGPRKDRDFLIVANSVVRDPALSLRARGLLVTILSHSDGWKTTIASLVEVLQEGREAVTSTMRELEAAGYVERVRRQDARGHWSTSTIVHEQPVPRDSPPGTEAPDDGQPVVRSDQGKQSNPQVAPSDGDPVVRQPRISREEEPRREEPRTEEPRTPLRSPELADPPPELTTTGRPVGKTTSTDVAVAELPTAQHLVAAWVDGYRERNQTEPNQALIRRMSSAAKQLAKGLSLEEMRAAWFTCKAAGREGRWDVVAFQPREVRMNSRARSTADDRMAQGLHVAEMLRAEAEQDQREVTTTPEDGTAFDLDDALKTRGMRLFG